MRLNNSFMEGVSMKCKECIWCTWACPEWMCMNPKHPEYKENSDYPITISLDDKCELFEKGTNDYNRLTQIGE